ncbi:hypothetical protein BDR07DRAFT_855428 [Suillus spraguei]|nr:hypothetical protein BDR07DRAFT_855428 [Suillus spraguei]
MARFFSHLYPSPQTLLTTVETLSVDLSSSFRKAIIPALLTSTPRLKALEMKGSLFTTEEDCSEIKSLLISYPNGLTELSLFCHLHDVPITVLKVIAPWPSLRSLTLKLGLKSIPSAPLHIPKPFVALTHLHLLFDHITPWTVSYLSYVPFKSSISILPVIIPLHPPISIQSI